MYHSRAEQFWGYTQEKSLLLDDIKGTGAAREQIGITDDLSGQSGYARHIFFRVALVTGEEKKALGKGFFQGKEPCRQVQGMPHTLA